MLRVLICGQTEMLKAVEFEVLNRNFGPFPVKHLPGDGPIEITKVLPVGSNDMQSFLNKKYS